MYIRMESAIILVFYLYEQGGEPYTRYWRKELTDFIIACFLIVNSTYSHLLKQRTGTNVGSS